jgi:hypothetical protein
VKYFTEIVRNLGTINYMVNLSTKAYVQLIPSFDSINELLSLQRSTPRLHSVIKPSSFHLTVLHIGKAERLYDEIKTFSDIDKDSFLMNFETLILKLESLILPYREFEFQLVSDSSILFGSTKEIVVLSLKPNAELIKIHSESLLLYTMFLNDCGIQDVDEFIKASRVLAHSSVLTPHVTLGRIHTDISANDVSDCVFSFKLDSIIN